MLAIIAVVLGVGRWAAWYFALPTFGYRTAERVTYARYKTQYNEAVDAWQTGEVGSDYYNDLPSRFAFLAAGGIAGSGPNAIFFPLWSAIPDDAGGYWYVEDGGSPDGFDMWGMVCNEPKHLDGNWWVCGVADGIPQSTYP